MGTAAVIDSSVTIEKNDGRATGFDFTNDTGAVIPSGSVITQGGLVGITTSPVVAGGGGSAEFTTGECQGYVMYVDPLAAEVGIGDDVLHPTTGTKLGYAVSEAIGVDDYASLTDGVAAPVGATCVYFVCPNALV